MNIIIIGAPGSGKGTQSKFLVNQYGLTQLSTGDLLRYEIKHKTELGIQIEDYISAGVLVPDDVIIRMVEEKLKRQDNFILDGFPRNISQAERLDSFLNSNRKKIDHVLYFHIDEALLVERITGRRINPNTGKEYHIKYNPPKVSGICDTDGSSLVQRPDDTEEKIRVRYATFEKETIPLIDFYKKKGNLIQIDASQDISDISRHISSVIKL